MKHTVLSTADVANLFNVTETTVKRWADEGKLKCQKTPGGHRKFHIKSVIDFAEAFGFSPTGTLSLLGGGEHSTEVELAVLRRDLTALADLFAERARTPHEADLYEFLSYLYQHHFTVTDIYDGVLRPGMHRIGELWEHGDISIAHEHRATSETINAITQLQSELKPKAPTGESALCACPDNEEHEIGLRSVASILRMEGWTVHYLGARTPMDSIEEFCRELRPSLVCLSVTLEDNVQPMIAGLGRIRSTIRPTKTRIVLGGSGLHEGRSDDLSGGSIISTCAGFLEYVRTEFQTSTRREMQMRKS